MGAITIGGNIRIGGGVILNNFPQGQDSFTTPGTYSCDIEFTVDSVVRSTETFDIPVIKGITEPIVEGV